MRSGIMYISLSYILWGIFPIYWKVLDHVSSEEILAHRIIWSFVFVLLLLLFQKRFADFLYECTKIIKSPKILLTLALSSFLISANWFVYIWAVNHDRVLETSLGYYINPLVSVLLGMIFLHEKLNKGQQTAFLFAAFGVLISTVHYGHVPWTSFILASTFGFYGLAKKVIKLDSAFGLALETFVVFPIGIIYVLYLESLGSSVFFEWDASTNFLLMGTGVITAIPLLLFAKGTPKIPMYFLGVLQYIAPTITFFLGVFLYHEPFTVVELITFVCIWTGIIIFTMSEPSFKTIWKTRISK
ncbi:EamA family transporter RarD [Aeribacillus sp. FSL K6-2848]|uniref:EamA family transporter RarD n=1 Tax=unclassified Aeribacillus TaxID=2640495 RepID=UPI0030CD93C8